jgi:ribosome-binding protein aMBF1 (putative translation factor)
MPANIAPLDKNLRFRNSASFDIDRSKRVTDDELGEIGERVRKPREQANQSQAQLAKRAGVDQSVVSRQEKGQRAPSCLALAAIAKALKVPTSVLIGDMPNTWMSEENSNPA